MFKRILSLLLALGMILSLSPRASLRAEAVSGSQTASAVESVSVTHINPLYADVVTETELNQPGGAVALDVEEYHTTIEAAGEDVREQMKARQETIVVGLQADMMDKQQLSDVMDAAMAHTGEPTEGDYLRWQYAGWSGTIGGYVSGSTYYLTLTYTMTYYTTAEQEAAVDSAVDSLLAELDLDDAGDYGKIRGIYDYICDNVTYDYENLEDDSYQLKFTAYGALIDGTSVCQGYAVLLYRLALELGVDCRLISGIGNGGSHGWNIVELDGLYYNVDSTWDTNYASDDNYHYFLVTDANFSNHTRDEAYATEEFYSAYPMGTENYTPGQDTGSNVVAEGTCGENLNWVLTNDGVLTISGEGEMEDYSENVPWNDYKSEITSVVIEEGATSIGDYAFTDCANLTAVELPESLASIGDYGFSGTGLTGITIPANVTTIGVQALRCPYLTAITVDESNSTFKDIDGILYSSGTMVQFPCAVTGAVVLPELTMVIGDYALSGCASLTGVNIPAYCEEIGANAFASCDALTEVYFRGDSVTIDETAFDGCLMTVYYPSANTTWTEDVMQNCGGTVTWEPYGEDLVAMGFCGENDVEKDTTCADNVSWILTSDGTMTFSGTGRAMDCHLGGNHPWIRICGSDASRVTSVVIEEGITYFGNFCFYNFVGEYVTSVTLPSTLTEIGTAAFGGVKVTELVLPEKLTTIGTYAFSNCTLLSAITFLGDAPEMLEDCFKSVTATAYYPAGNETWTSDVMQDYGGTITWVAAYDVFEDSEDVVVPGNALSIHVDADVNEFVAVYVDGEPVDSDCYTVTEGSTIITFTAEYLATLSAGEHQVTIEFENGSAIADITVEEESAVTFTGASVSLDGSISVNYYVKLSEEVLADEAAYMEFNFAGQTQTVKVCDLTAESDGRYKFTCRVAAKQMAETITAQIHLGDGTPVGKALEYSVRKYYDAIMSSYGEKEPDANLVNLLKAMLNYGAYSQVYFDYNTENLANANLADEDKVLPETVDLEDYRYCVSGSEEGISVYGASLILESVTTIRFYFQLTGDKTIDEYEFVVDGKAAEPVHYSGSYYYVDMPNVYAKHLDVMYTASVGDLSVTYSGLSYVEQVLNWEDAAEATVNVVKALYLYNQAANAYFGA